MRFHKYHALGNDYIVLNPADFPSWGAAPTTDQIRVVCHRNFGVGSDGILWGPLPSRESQHGLRIFNPDGSEAEKSGNGLRIFSRFLWDRKLVRDARFTVETPGGHVRSEIRDGGGLITVAMGSVSFDSARIPVNVTGPAREVLNEKVQVLDREFTYCAATIGNPHCVIPLPAVTAELAHRYGPHLETHPLFPRKTNVQFLQVIDRKNIRIEIWERGAGYTLASGSSSSASAAVAHRLGLVDRDVTVHMPGGTIGIEIGDGFSIMMTGTVNKVAEGVMHPELFAVKV
ncbi:MAG: diaminopimelate epimerase [Opitutaceae bacterium]